MLMVPDVGAIVTRHLGIIGAIVPPAILMKEEFKLKLLPAGTPKLLEPRLVVEFTVEFTATTLMSGIASGTTKMYRYTPVINCKLSLASK